MINKIVVLCLSLLSLYFLLSGLSNFINAEQKIQQFGLAITSENGLVSFRVAYGGLMIAIGVVLFAATWYKTMRLSGLYLGGSVVLSFLVTRSVAVLAMGRVDAYQGGLLAAELAEVLIVSALIYGYRKQSQLSDTD